MDYKGQERSNLVFSEFRRSLLYSKTFFMSYLQLSGCRFFLFGYPDVVRDGKGSPAKVGVILLEILYEQE